MKKLYRRPYHIEPIFLYSITFIAIGLLFWVEYKTPSNYLAQLNDVKRLCQNGFDIIKNEKALLSLSNKKTEDPKNTGMIGTWKSTPITSTFSHLSIKQATVNPEFSALVFHWLKEIGIKPGDFVALSITGSFPALNIATYAALKKIKAQPIIITSLTASQWGANQPNLSWLDMETLLFNNDVVNFRSIAVSYGALNDHATNINPEGMKLLDDIIMRNQKPELIYTGTLQGNIEKKMSLYKRIADKRPIKAFINIGGGLSSTGSTNDKKNFFKPGLNTELNQTTAIEIKGLMYHFLSAGTPVIHLSSISSLIKQYNIDSPENNPIYQETDDKVLKAFLSIIIIILLLAMVAYRYKYNQPEASI